MKNRYVLSVSLMILALILFACSGKASSAGTYRKIGGQGKIEAAAFRTITETSEAETTEPAQIKLTCELKADEEPSEYTADEDMTVYSQAKEKASVLGEIKTGEKINVYASMDDNWFKISYNGRIAYVQHSEETEETTEETAPEPVYYYYYEEDDDEEEEEEVTTEEPTTEPETTTEPPETTTEPPATTAPPETTTAAPEPTPADTSADSTEESELYDDEIT